MTRPTRRLAAARVAVFGLLLSVAACAGGPKLADIQASIPPVPADRGRVWLFRDASPFGFAIQPAISLNGRKVGDSVPGGFFYVDEAPGNVVITTATEVDYSVKFILQPREERFVRTKIGFGILVGRVVPELVDPAEARTELATKSYTGGAKPGS